MINLIALWVLFCSLYLLNMDNFSLLFDNESYFFSTVYACFTVGLYLVLKLIQSMIDKKSRMILFGLSKIYTPLIILIWPFIDHSLEIQFDGLDVLLVIFIVVLSLDINNSTLRYAGGYAEKSNDSYWIKAGWPPILYVIYSVFITSLFVLILT